MVMVEQTPLTFDDEENVVKYNDHKIELNLYVEMFEEFHLEVELKITKKNAFFSL